MIVKYNKSRNLIEEHAYKPNLQDVAQPNLFRNIFSYGSIPKTAFNFRTVQMDTPKDLFITDTTFRDLAFDKISAAAVLTALVVCVLILLLQRAWEREI